MTETHLYLVRHGPTHAKSMVGWTDLPADLSDTAAIDRLSDRLPADAVVVSSDLTRAATTADAIQGARLRLPHVADLREIHFGKWEMQTWKQIEAKDPHLIRAYWETPGEIRAPGGESWNDISARVSEAVDHLISTHLGRSLIIVAHFGAILTQIQRAGGLSAEQALGHKIDNLSMTHLTHSPTGWATHVINHIP